MEMESGLKVNLTSDFHTLKRGTTLEGLIVAGWINRLDMIIESDD